MTGLVSCFFPVATLRHETSPHDRADPFHAVTALVAGIWTRPTFLAGLGLAVIDGPRTVATPLRTATASTELPRRFATRLFDASPETVSALWLSSSTLPPASPPAA
jgi:hypothetical protein